MSTVAPTPGVFKKPQNSFLKFIWNRDTKEFLGRDANAWARIGIFYLVFYSGLAGFFAVMLAVFYRTLDVENRPTYTPGGGGSILQNPAVGFRPLPREENVESTLIWYKNGDNKDIKHWIDQLSKFIEDYEGINDDGQHMKSCSKDDPIEDDGRACKFQDSWLGDICSKANKWGYDRNTPCVLLKLNRMMDWKPDYYKTIDELPDDMPEYLKALINATISSPTEELEPMVWVSCEGENPADKEYLPKMKFQPQPGFPVYYFPYRKTPGYLSPLVAVEIHDPQPNVLINIECKAWAKNILHDRMNRLGMAHFELMKD